MIGTGTVFSALKVIIQELREDAKSGIIVILLVINWVQYLNNVAVRGDVRALVEQRIEEQNKKAAEMQHIYNQRVVEAADNAATRWEMVKLSMEIKALQEPEKKKKKR
jgi:hypothetical protein